MSGEILSAAAGCCHARHIRSLAPPAPSNCCRRSGSSIFFLASSSLTLLSGMRSQTRFFRTRRGTALRLRPALDSRFRRVSTFLPLPGPHFSVELTSGARALRIEVGTSSNNLCRFPLSSCSCPAIFVSSLVSPASVASPSYPFAFRLFLVRISIKIPFLRRC